MSAANAGPTANCSFFVVKAFVLDLPVAKSRGQDLSRGPETTLVHSTRGGRVDNGRSRRGGGSGY